MLVIALATSGAADRGLAGQDDRGTQATVTTASALLSPAERKGPHHTVAEPVTVEEYFYRFTLTSTFGPFEAIGRSELAVRIQEIAALAQLQNVSGTEVFLAAAGQSVVAVGQSAAAVVTDPAAAAKGIGGGIKRVGVNIGRRTQRAVAAVGDDDDAGAPSSGGVASSVLGVNTAARRWAQKVGVDPYTTNVALRHALDAVAKVDAAGSIATKVVLPVPNVVGMTSTVGDLVWGKDPEAVRKINEERLQQLTVAGPVTASLVANRWFTLTSHTRLVAALHAVNVPGAADYVQTAAAAASEREVLFFVESAEMLAQQHSHEPVRAVLTDSRAMVAAGSDGVARLLLPVDRLAMTGVTRKALGEIAARARKDLGAQRLELVTAADTSPPARREMSAAGWQLPPARPH